VTCDPFVPPAHTAPRNDDEPIVQIRPPVYRPAKQRKPIKHLPADLSEPGAHEDVAAVAI
jgi:hypothetical protein